VAQPARTEVDRHWLRAAIELSERCPPSPTAFSVLSAGYSRELDPADHAEEVALAKIGWPQTADVPQAGDLLLAGDLAQGGGLAGATMYSSLEPCAARASRPTPCADLIIASGIGRVVIAWREPPIFVPGGGAVRLRKAGLAVTVMPELAAAARAVNAHLLES
jgi:diaminohydroxyphosphoribosylaminopyrimidine deaminase / 5-amino-6-(5-phosphoribosylamino)uracil reductase